MRLLAMVREMMVFVSIRIVMVMMVIVTDMDMILRNSRGRVVRMMVMRNHCVIAHQQIDRQQQETDDLTLFHGRKDIKNSVTHAIALELRKYIHHSHLFPYSIAVLMPFVIRLAPISASWSMSASMPLRIHEAIMVRMAPAQYWLE